MRIDLPLRRRRVSGFSCPRPEVRLRIRTRYGDFVPLLFVVDTGADLTTMPVRMAELHGIPFPREDAGSVYGLLGRAARYLGTIHLSLGGEEYDWPCNFVQTPNPTGPGTEAYAVLGRAGFLTAYDFQIDETHLTITRRYRSRRWRRALSRWLSRPFQRERSLNDPL